MTVVYLDNNATTHLDPLAAQGMHEAGERYPGNPSSQHSEGRRARARLDDARDAIIQMLGGCTRRRPADRLIFTSGGTEANNHAVLGLAGPLPGRILVSQVEHPSVLGAAAVAASRGFEVQEVPVDSNGLVRLDLLEELLQHPTRLVSIQWANQETGVLQPVADIGHLCHAHGAVFHCDAVQGIGKIPICFQEMTCDALTFAPHKFHGPRGIGGLLLRGDVTPEPLLRGGPQQLGIRAGTEPVALAVGAELALKQFLLRFEDSPNRLSELRDRLQSGILKCFESAKVIAAGVPRAPQTLCVSFPGVDRQLLVIALDRAGVCCSTGSACASGSSEPSPVLAAMKLPAPWIAGAIRLSVGAFTTTADTDRAMECLGQVLGPWQRSISG